MGFMLVMAGFGAILGLFVLPFLAYGMSAAHESESINEFGEKMGRMIVFVLGVFLIAWILE